MHKKSKFNLGNMNFIVDLKNILMGGLFLLSVHCYSDSKRWNDESDKLRYECGQRCISLEKVVFELRANKDFYKESEGLSKKMRKFEIDFNEEFKKLKSSHKIHFESGFGPDSFVPGYVSQRSALRVYVGLSKDQCRESGVNLDVVTLAENNMSFDKFKCESLDGPCFDNALLRVFQERVVSNVNDPVIQHVQY